VRRGRSLIAWRAGLATIGAAQRHAARAAVEEADVATGAAGGDVDVGRGQSSFVEHDAGGELDLEEHRAADGPLYGGKQAVVGNGGRCHLARDLGKGTRRAVALAEHDEGRYGTGLYDGEAVTGRQGEEMSHCALKLALPACARRGASFVGREIEGLHAIAVGEQDRGAGPEDRKTRMIGGGPRQTVDQDLSSGRRLLRGAIDLDHEFVARL
jgi:hypothetical protein